MHLIGNHWKFSGVRRKTRTQENQKNGFSGQKAFIEAFKKNCKAFKYCTWSR